MLIFAKITIFATRYEKNSRINAASVGTSDVVVWQQEA
jgi:hypothetical protein